jgi:hypothetical protein
MYATLFLLIGLIALGYIITVAFCCNFIRFPRVERQHKCFIYASASAAGGSRSDNDLNPYEVIFDNSRFCSKDLMSWNCCVWWCGAFCLNYFWVWVFQVLGVNPIEGFDMVKAAYAKKRKEAQVEGDEVAAAQVCYYFISL